MIQCAIQYNQQILFSPQCNTLPFSNYPVIPTSSVLHFPGPFISVYINALDSSWVLQTTPLPSWAALFLYKLMGAGEEGGLAYSPKDVLWWVQKVWL